MRDRLNQDVLVPEAVTERRLKPGNALNGAARIRSTGGIPGGIQ
jgi:hypothetical protein